MKKIISGIAIALTMVGAMVMNADAVNSTLSTSGVKVIDSSDSDGGNTCLQILTETVNGSFSLEPTDIIKATIFGDEGVDTSNWQILLNAFDSDWGGWSGVLTEPGVLKVETTVQYLMNAIGCTSISGFGGFRFQATGTAGGANVNYTFAIAPGYDGISGDYSYYENNDGTINIAYYSGNATTLEIPSTLNGKEVTGIEELAFSGCTSLKSVVIPDSITIIYDNAFLNCTALETVTIPASVTDISDTAFDGCDSLTTINYETNTWGHKFAYDNGFTAESYMVFDEQEDGTLELMSYGGTDTLVTIPSSVDGKAVTAINQYAFWNCTSLQSIEIPVGITRIEDYVFEGCTALESVVIPEGVTRLEYHLFYDCSSLKEVTIPASATHVPIDAFLNCLALEEIHYTTNTAGHMFAFQNAYTMEPCVLTEELDDGTLEITKYGNRASTFTLPSELNGKKITSIGSQAFGNYLTCATMTIPDTITNISEKAFSGCKTLTSLDIPDSVKNIGDNAFLNCTKLTSITIPESVAKISTTAFSGCSDELVIHCYKDSTAHIYAASNGISYELIEDEADEPEEITPPTTPENLTYVADGTSLTLSWDEVDSADGYTVYLYVFGGWAKLGDVTTCEYTVSGLAPCTEYKFAVAAYNEAAGERATSDKAETTVTPLHDYDDTYTTDKAPTCTEEGTESIHCKNCDTKKDERPIPAKNHSYTETFVAPTYSQQGYTLHECECGDNYKDNFTDKLTLPTVSNANAEQFGRFVILSWDNVADVDGYTIYLFDGEKYVEYGRAVSNYYVFVGLSPCTQYKFAVGCYVTEDGRAANGETTEFIFSTEHEYEEEYTVDKAPTCSEEGSESIHCKHCDAKKDERPIPTNEHTYTDTVVAPTYFGQGYTRHDCDNCDYYYDDNFTDMLKLSTPEISVSTEKNFVILDWTAVENADGYIVYLYDGEKYVEYGRTIANSYVFAGLKPCTQYKFAVGAYITIDNATITSELAETSVSTAHDYEENYTTDKAPTCEEDGQESIHCKNCGAKKDERPISATGHSYTNTVVAPTYFGQGYTRHDCDNCYYYYDDNFTEKLLLDAVKDFALASRNYNSITVKWSANAGLSGYIIQQLKNGEWVNIAEIDDNTVTEYKITNLSPDVTYKFRIAGYMAENGLIAYTQYSDETAIRTAPAQTQGFAITGRGSDYLTITWTRNENASGYIIQEQINGVWTNVANIRSGDTVSYKITGLIPNSFHRYRMVAYMKDELGTCYGKYTGSAPGYTAPSMVTALNAEAEDDGSITVSWDKNASANGYVIDIYRDGKWSQLVKIASADTTSYSVSGLLSQTTYKFRIKSYATNGTLTIYSTYSGAVSAKTV